MAGFFKRALNVAIGVDETANAELGGRYNETLSGSAGRALAAHKWWAPVAVGFINTLMRNPQHCQQAAADEEKQRLALGEKP